MLKNIPPSSEMNLILAGKLSDLPREVVDYSISESKIGKIIDRLSVFSDSNSIIGEFLIELDIRNDFNLIDLINNIRVKGFNFLLILYLFSEDDIDDFMSIPGIKISEEEKYLGETLSAINIEGDKEIKIFMKFKKFISLIYKGKEPNFNVKNEEGETFLEFLLSTYSYYLFFKVTINGGKLVSDKIFNFLSFLLKEHKLFFDKKLILTFIDTLFNKTDDIDFKEGMDDLKKLFNNYDFKLSVDELNPEVFKALEHYKRISRI
ncbi:MAG: hypothetical protein PHI37_04125 [Candidatus Gracilibacteria bacterium]|nr:hypothetical protein [Candidatus Gracilibacteria bacterium]